MAISPIANKDPAARTKLNDVIAEVNAAAVANQTEVNGGTDNAKRITPLALETRIVNGKTASQIETNQGTVNNKFVTPLNLAGKNADQATVNAGTNPSLIVTPATLTGRLANKTASQGDVNSGTGSDFVTAETLGTRLTNDYNGRNASRAAAVASAVDAEEVARDAAISAARVEVAAVLERPGANPLAFTNAHLGGTSGTVDGVPVLTARGYVQRVTGDGRVTYRKRVPVLSGLSWRANVVLRRETNPTDPAGDSVEVQLAWISNSGTIVANHRAFPAVNGAPLFVADGAQNVEFTFGGTDTDWPAPAGAVDAAVTIRTFGLDGQTDVEVIRLDALSTDLLSLPGDLAAEEAARIAADAAEAAARDAAIAAAVAASIERPGGNPSRYTNNLVGGSAGTVDGVTATSVQGAVQRLTGDMRVTMRERIPVLPGLDWLGKVYLSRTTNPSDPAGDSVQVQLLWLNSNGTLLQNRRVFPVSLGTPLFVADGQQVVEFTFGTDESEYPAPAGAVDALISVRTYGADGVTDVEVIHVEPGAGAIGLARVKALESVEVGYFAVDPATVELGMSVTPTLTWSTIGTAKLVSQVINPGTVALGPTVREWTAPAAITNDRTYTLTLTDSEGNETEAAIPIDFRHRMWWGVDAADALDEASVLALANTDLITSISREMFLSPTDQYLYVAYPQTPYGPPSSVRIFGFDETAAVETDLVSVTTPGGLTVNYRVIRSPFKLSGSNIRFEVLA